MLSPRKAQVVIADINATAGALAAAEIKTAGGQAISVPTDVSDEGQVAAMTAAVVDQLGRIDILVNNAGVVVHKLLIDLDLAALAAAARRAAYWAVSHDQHVGRHMVERVNKAGRRQDRQYFLGFGAMGRVKGAPTVRPRAD